MVTLAALYGIIAGLLGDFTKLDVVFFCIILFVAGRITNVVRRIEQTEKNVLQAIEKQTRESNTGPALKLMQGALVGMRHEIHRLELEGSLLRQQLQHTNGAEGPWQSGAG